MKKEQIAVQLFTLRDYLKTPEDIAKTLKKVKAIGYDAVQISGMGPIAEKDLSKLLDEIGLVCCVTHEPGIQIVEDTDKVIERLNKLKCKYTAYPHPHKPLTTEKEVFELAKSLNTAAEKMSYAGKVLSYHNHAIEFCKFNGRTILEILYDEATAIQSELDTFWIQHGGANPTTWIKNMAERLPLLHLKEFTIIDNKITMCHIGGGNLEWNSIISAAEAGGTKWYIVEQDRDWIDNDPFKAIKLSFEFLAENYLS